MGEGEAFYQGERLPGRTAMERAGIPIPGLQARDGLAAINGSNLLTAMSALHLYDMNRWLKQAEIACAMSLEALLANLKPYDVRLHQARGFNGAIRAANGDLEMHRRERPDDRKDEDQGPGCLFDALITAGDWSSTRCDRLCPGARWRLN